MIGLWDKFVACGTLVVKIWVARSWSDLVFDRNIKSYWKEIQSPDYFKTGILNQKSLNIFLISIIFLFPLCRFIILAPYCCLFCVLSNYMLNVSIGRRHIQQLQGHSKNCPVYLKQSLSHLCLLSTTPDLVCGFPKPLHWYDSWGATMFINYWGTCLHTTPMSKSEVLFNALGR